MSENSNKKGIEIDCYVCHHSFIFDDSNIPKSARYEVWCPVCNAKIIMRKFVESGSSISLKELSELKKKHVIETGYKSAARNKNKDDK